MALWLAALVKQLQIMGSNPSQSHILEESGGVEEGDRGVDGFFGAITTGCMCPICTLNQMKNEITTTTTGVPLFEAPTDFSLFSPTTSTVNHSASSHYCPLYKWAYWAVRIRDFALSAFYAPLKDE